jgi:hypothetical protein
MALDEHVNAFQLIDCREAMRAHLPYKTTEVAGGIYDQNCVGRLVVNVECGLTSRHLAKRSCRWCDPVSGQCRHLCVAETWPKDQAGSQFLNTFQFSEPD